MSSVFTREFILEQIEALKTRLTANVAASTEASSVQSYTLETGQTRQSVTSATLSALVQERQSILNELRMWEAMLDGGTAAVRGRPSW